MNLGIKMFIEEKGKELLQKKLYRNFVIHVCNLFEFGVLGPGGVFKAISRMQAFIRDHVLQKTMEEWTDQRQHWIKTTPAAVAVTKESASKSQSSSSKPTASPSTATSARKDFAGIFKNENMSPFVVLEAIDATKLAEAGKQTSESSEKEKDEKTSDKKVNESSSDQPTVKAQDLNGGEKKNGNSNSTTTTPTTAS